MRALLGLTELGLSVWGIIAFWGTPWSIAMLVWLAIDIILAAFVAGQKATNRENEAEDSVFSSFFKKDEEDD